MATRVKLPSTEAGRKAMLAMLTEAGTVTEAPPAKPEPKAGFDLGAAKRKVISEHPRSERVTLQVVEVKDGSETRTLVTKLITGKDFEGNKGGILLSKAERAWLKSSL